MSEVQPGDTVRLAFGLALVVQVGSRQAKATGIRVLREHSDHWWLGTDGKPQERGSVYSEFIQDGYYQKVSI